MQQNTYDEETKRKTAFEALEYCRENGVSLNTWAKRNGHDAKTVRRWVSKYYPEELVKYYTPKAQAASRPEAVHTGFVPIANGRQRHPEGTVFRVSYHGAEIETDAEGLDTVLRAVQALSRSAL